MTARIYRPAKSAMQSGLGKSKNWILEFEPDAAREIDPLMGWTSSSDMNSQLKIKFDSQDEAIAYAKQNGIAYRLDAPKSRKQIPKSYSDNFKFGRRGSWTH